MKYEAVEAVQSDAGAGGDANAHPVPDSVLLSAVRAGDEDALLALYDRYHALLFTLALRIVGEREVAEEVLQDAFLHAWDGARTFDPKRGAVLSWLFGIVRNRAIDALRSRHQRGRRREANELEDTPGRDDASDIAPGVAMRLFVRAALDALPVQERQPLELVYFGGLSHREAALQLGQPLGTVKGRIRSAMDSLRRSLGRADGGAIS
jgi:RNA polymerase sigma-70 factor (ECF subfamily)